MSATVVPSVAAVDLTSAVVFTASVALVLASAAREFAAAAASRASSIWRSRLASSSFSNVSCCCCDCRAWRSSSISAAMAESALSAFLAALAFAAWAALAECGSASLGVSAKAVPETRSIDSVSAARFFISSLFKLKLDLLPK